MHGKCSRIVIFSALLMLLASRDAAGSATDMLKWPPGQAPAGQSNGPDSLDDIWQGLFNAWGIDPQGDEDKDGTKNILECIAGTDPFKALDCFKIGNMTVSSTTVTFTSKVEAGKKYRVISADAPDGATWSPEPLQTPVSGVLEYVPSADQAEAFLSVQKPVGSRKFYKLETSDQDSNGDGLSDWVSRKLGLNPAVTDSNGDGISDVAEIAQELTSQDTVTLSADTAFTSEDGGPPGLLRLRRTRTLLGATVTYTVGGTAGAGDFTPLTGTAYFAPGASEAFIAITPNADSGLEGGESVTVTLTGGTTSTSTGIQVSGKSQASVIISNSTAATGTGLLGRYYDNVSSTYAHGLNFGEIGTYAYTRAGTTPNFTGTVVIPYSKTPALKLGDVVRITFTGGNLNTTAFNHLDYSVSAVNPGVNFTISLAGASLPANSSSSCNFSIQSFPHPAVIERVDATVDYEWMGGTPNGVGVTTHNVLQNYSDSFEMYLSPATAGSYRFQLDADDKARVLLDLNDGNGLQQILEHGWDSAATTGTFKVSGSFTLAVPANAAQRYRMRVEHIQSTDQARCRLQWSRNSGTFANIPQAEQFTHTQGATYSFSRTNATTGTATITLASHGLAAGNTVSLGFSGGTLFTQTAADPAGYSGTFTVASATTHTFTVPISGTSLPADGTAACFVEGRPTSTTTGVYNKVYLNSTLGGAPARVGVDAAVTSNNNGIWGSGAPNGAVITQYRITENYSDSFDMYLSPATAGTYRFQLDADDKARVLLDLNDGNGLRQILEHGWDSQATVGSFKISSGFALAVPATSAQRYRMRVEHVETTGEARCRLQWSRDGGTFANIPQGEQFTHTQGATYAFTRTNATTGTATITLNGHGLSNSTPVTIAFTSGNLFTPNIFDPNGYSSTFTVANAATNTFTVPITGTNLPGDVSAGSSCILELRPASTTTGVYNKTYLNTSFTGTPGRIGVDAAVTTSNNGLWGVGTPDVDLIHPDTFAIRWSGQVQPQFTEDYTFVVHADDGATLKINGQVQPLRSHVSTNQGSSTYAYNNTTGETVVTYSNSVLQLNCFTVGETVRLDPSSGNLNYSGGATYAYNSVNGDMVVTYSAMANFSAGGFQAGQTVFLDPTNGNLTSLASLPYVITAADGTTFTVSVGAGLFATGTGALNIADTMDFAITAVTTNTFTVNMGVGKHPAGSSGNMNIEIVNKPLKDWSSFGNERYVRVPMMGGARYDIELDYWENSGFSRCRLFWYSPSQPRQIIPKERLYPASSAQAPPSHVSSTDAVALVGGLVSIPVVASNGASVSVSGAPAWLTYNNGVLSGTPPVGTAGNYQILVTLTDAAGGTTMSLINLRVEDTGGNIGREQWDGISGTSIASIPVHSPPASTSSLSRLQTPPDAADNFGARIHGYITAPATGNYYFWIAASHAAELWISNDDEPVNAFKRAWVTTGTGAEEWNNAGEPKQKTAWLALEEGKRYYIEILHKAGTGTAHLAVGWQKPGQSGNSPTEIVPGFVLSPYVAPPAGSTPGTLYIASMLSQNGALTNGVGTSTMRLSEDESTAIVSFAYSGLTGPMNDWHVHVDPYLTHASMIVYDGVEPVHPNDGPQPDGSHHWTIESVGTLSKADIIEIIKQGKAYINLHTAAYPAGEIRGNYTLAAGSRTFSPPPPPPSWAEDSDTDTGAVRFLTQATYGANIADINALQALVPAGGKGRYELWIENELTKPASPHLPEVLRLENASAQGAAFDEQLSFNAWWWRSITGDDQLRQRVAFALSEIMVVSGQGPLDNNALSLSYFYDQLLTHAFGNFREVLEATTLTPTMGRYLDMLRNDKPDQAVGRIPNENYAREIKQLFSVGLFRMWPDGTLMLTSRDRPIDTYSQREIIGFAHVFTGWDYGYDGAARTALNAPSNWTRQMREVPARHFTGEKRLLNNEVLPGLQTLGGQPLDPYAVHNSTHINQPAYQALPGQELEISHDQLFNHPNVGPFICRQLIQRLVTSHPSRDYLYRVVQKFNDNGQGVRGDMRAVIKAILLDYEARSPVMVTKPAFGKQREPVMRVAAAARAFRVTPFTGTYTQTGTNTINIAATSATKLINGNNILLEFTSNDATPAPWTGIYSAGGVSGNNFTVTAQGWATSVATTGYVIPANSTTCTVTMNNHWLQNGHKVFVDFTSGGANGVTGLDGQVYTLTSASAESGNNGTFTFSIPAGQVSTTARNGTCMIPRFSPGSYTSASSGLPAPNDRRVTMDTNSNHELNVGDLVQINFYGGNPLPVDMVATVDTVVDGNTWTFLAPSVGTNLGTSQGVNSVYQFPLKSLPLTRTGTVGSRPSTFRMDNTDSDLGQSPLNSPTVFNFFLPDFKFPGALASQGITTPEFQDTAETTVVRQSNFIYNGLFNPSNTNGISSFKSGGNALVMDYSPWMAAPNLTDLGLGAPAVNTVAWTNNQNLDTLINHLNTLLMANQMPAQARTIIRNFVATPIASITVGSPCQIHTTVPHNLTNGSSVVLSGVTNGSYSQTVNNTTTSRVVTVVDADTFTLAAVNCTAAPNAAGLVNAHVSMIPYNNGNANPSDTNKRDRLRAILHLILTSPDFTIQR